MEDVLEESPESGLQERMGGDVIGQDQLVHGLDVKDEVIALENIQFDIYIILKFSERQLKLKKKILPCRGC